MEGLIPFFRLQLVAVVAYQVGVEAVDNFPIFALETKIFSRREAIFINVNRKKDYGTVRRNRY